MLQYRLLIMLLVCLAGWSCALTGRADALPPALQLSGSTAADMARIQSGALIKSGFEIFTTHDLNTDLAALWSEGKLERQPYIEGVIPNYKYRKEIFWIGLKVDFSGAVRDDHHIVIEYAPIDNVELFTYSNGRFLERQRSGDHVHVSDKSAYFRKPAFRLSGEETHLWFRINTASAVQLPMAFYDRVGFQKEVLKDSIEQSLYFGALIALGLYNFFLAITTRFQFYRLYVCFLVSFGLFQASFFGYGAMFLWPDANPYWIDRSVTIFISLVGVFSYLFAFDLLELKESAPRFYLWGRRILLFHSPHLLAVWFLPYEMGIKWVFALAALWSSYLIVTAVYLSKQGRGIAQIYLLAWLVFIVGTIVNLLLTLGLVPYNMFTVYAQQVGSVTEFTLLSLTMALRVSLLEKQSKTMLEKQVEERTASLAEAQQKLVSSEKMAALGVFTAGMAHEINNPANFVMAGSQNARAQFADLERFVQDLMDSDTAHEIRDEFHIRFRRIDESLGLVDLGITRIDRVIKNLRATHPEGTVGSMPGDVVDILETAWRVLEPSLRIPVTIKSDFGAREMVPCVVADLHQVFLAVLGNAVHALEDACRFQGGDFTPVIMLGSSVSEGHFVLTITDNGPGIPTDILGRVFDPFYTTKDVGRGAGLGLSMARDVMRRHHGSIDIVVSVPGKTVVRIALPLAT